MITVRNAQLTDLPELQKDLATDKRWEQVHLEKGIAVVVEKDGEKILYGHARLVWQIEPIKWMRGKKKTCNSHEQKKATYLAISQLERWLRDTGKNPHIRFYFCGIRNRVMQKLARSFGMFPLYEKVKFFGKDL